MPQTDITAEDLDRVESESAIEVRPDDIVLFHTPGGTGTQATSGT
jgi:hypothetical protein